MKFDLIKLVFFLSWCASLLFGGIQQSRVVLYLLSLVGFAGAIFNEELSFKVLSWFFSIWIAYLIAAHEGKRSQGGIAQKFFIVQLLGVMLSVLGVALGSIDHSLILILVGTLTVGPSIFHTIFFSRFFESLSKRAYFFSVAIPAMVGIDLLLSVKPEIKQHHPMAFDLSLLLIGGSGFLFNSFFALIRNQTKTMLVFISQAWLGALFMLLTSDDPNLTLAVASIFVFLLNGPMLYVEAKRFTRRVSAVMISFFFGFPLFIGFNAIFYSVRTIHGYSPWFSVLFMMALAFQSGAVILNLSKASIGEGGLRTRFILLSLLSVITAMAIHFLGLNHALG